MVAAIGATLAIEGTTLSTDEIEESLHKAEVSQQLARKEQEAENSKKVYNFIVELVNRNEGTFRYTEAMLKQIHKYFTNDLNYLSNIPGQYRGNFTPTFGEPRKKSLCRTNAEVEAAMSLFVGWLNQRSSGLLRSNPVVRAIMAHYYLAEIHPFADGNGRTARALEALVLYVNGMNSYCFWSLANFWSTHRDQYILQLGNIRATCDAWDYLIWGIKGYLGEIKRVKGLVLKKVKQLMFLDYVKYLAATKKTKEIKINNRIVDLLDVLVQTGRIPLDKFLAAAPIAILYNNTSPATKSRDFKKLDQLALVRTSKENNRVYIEPNFGILDSLQYRV
jgi:Fic family protein